jgi:hypothetical protein
MKKFQYNPLDLLATFLDHLVEADWQGRGPDAAIHVIRDLHHRLQAENCSAENRSIAEFEFDVPPTDPVNDHDVNSTTARAPSVFDIEQANLQREQQAVFATVASHLQLEMPDSPLNVHVEGELGGGKTYLLNVLLSYSSSIGRLTLPAAFQAKVARKFPGGQTATIGLFFRPTVLEIVWRFVQNVQTICKNETRSLSELVDSYKKLG